MLIHNDPLLQPLSLKQLLWRSHKPYTPPWPQSNTHSNDNRLPLNILKQLGGWSWQRTHISSKQPNTPAIAVSTPPVSRLQSYHLSSLVLAHSLQIPESSAPHYVEGA